MNYWLDIRLKLINFWKKHKNKIIIILIAWAIVYGINYYLKHQNKIIVPKTTYEPHNPVMDNTETVPESYKQSINELIDNYIKYCNNKEYENAYNLLSDSYKSIYCNTLDGFKKYVDNKFNTKKIYNIQNFSNVNNTYVYQVRILNDILATGTTDEYTFTEEKFVVKKENDVLKLSLNGYCGTEQLNIQAEDDYMGINIVKKVLEYDTVTYTVEFKNKSSYYIVLADNSETNEITLKLPNEIRAAKNMVNSNLVILPNETYTREIAFDKYFDDGQEATQIIFNDIRILPEFTGIDENIQKEKEKAIKLYSLGVNLIPKQR